jgi:hypothetical protein
LAGDNKLELSEYILKNLSQCYGNNYISSIDKNLLFQTIKNIIELFKQKCMVKESAEKKSTVEVFCELLPFIGQPTRPYPLPLTVLESRLKTCDIKSKQQLNEALSFYYQNNIINPFGVYVNPFLNYVSKPRYYEDEEGNLKTEPYTFSKRPKVYLTYEHILKEIKRRVPYLYIDNNAIAALKSIHTKNITGQMNILFPRKKQGNNLLENNYNENNVPNEALDLLMFSIEAMITNSLIKDEKITGLFDIVKNIDTGYAMYMDAKNVLAELEEQIKNMS